MSNNPPRNAEDYIADLNALANTVDEWASYVITEDNAPRLRDIIGRIDKIAKSAEKDRKAIKEPFLESGRKVDKDFKPVKEMASEMMRPLKDNLTDYLQEQERIKREAAEAARKEAEEKARQAEAAKGDAFIGEHAAREAEAAADDAKYAEISAATNTVSGFEADRSIGLRTYRKAVIVDAGALALHFADHPDVMAVCEKLANAQIRAAKGGPVNIPGVQIKEEKKVA